MKNEKNNEETKDKVGELPITNKGSRIPGRRRSTLMKGFVNTLGNNAIRELLDEPIFDMVGRFKEGKSFGELALIKSKPRATRVVCETPCQFA